MGASGVLRAPLRRSGGARGGAGAGAVGGRGRLTSGRGRPDRLPSRLRHAADGAPGAEAHADGTHPRPTRSLPAHRDRSARPWLSEGWIGGSAGGERETGIAHGPSHVTGHAGGVGRDAERVGHRLEPSASMIVAPVVPRSSSSHGDMVPRSMGEPPSRRKPLTMRWKRYPPLDLLVDDVRDHRRRGQPRGKIPSRD